MSGKLCGIWLFILSFSMWGGINSLSAAEETALSKYFHSGKILAAEISENKPEIRNQMPYAVPVQVSGTVGYASVVVVLDYQRTLGLYDYSLKDNTGHTYKCIAIAKGDRPFDAKKWQYPYTKKGERYSMLYKVSCSNGKNEFKLHFNYRYANIPDVPLRFKKMQRFFKPSAIPLRGILGKKSISLPKMNNTAADTKNVTSGNSKADVSSGGGNKTPASESKKSDVKFIQASHPQGHWTPKMVSTKYKGASWQIKEDASILKKVVGVRFLYTKGASRLNIKNVRLVVDDKIVARDNHAGYTGAKSKNNDYFFHSLKLPGKCTKVVIRAKVAGDGGNDSYGNIYLLLKQ